MGFLFPKPAAPSAAPYQVTLPAPSPAPAAPERTDTAEEAARQRRRYGITGGASDNLGATGGMGVNVSSTYNAVTALLGGGRV